MNSIWHSKRYIQCLKRRSKNKTSKHHQPRVWQPNANLWLMWVPEWTTSSIPSNAEAFGESLCIAGNQRPDGGDTCFQADPDFVPKNSTSGTVNSWTSIWHSKHYIHNVWNDEARTKHPNTINRGCGSQTPTSGSCECQSGPHRWSPATQRLSETLKASALLGTKDLTVVKAKTTPALTGLTDCGTRGHFGKVSLK